MVNRGIGEPERVCDRSPQRGLAGLLRDGNVLPPFYGVIAKLDECTWLLTRLGKTHAAGSNPADPTILLVTWMVRSADQGGSIPYH